MRFKRLAVLALFLASAVLAWRFATAVMVAKAVGPPHASRIQIIKYALRPKYQMAVPHRTLLSTIRTSFVPEANACPVVFAGQDIPQMPSPQCDNTTYKAGCQTGCGFCGHCPDCFNGPCTIYRCVSTTKVKKCVEFWNTSPGCSTCVNAGNVPCNPPG